MRKKRTAATGLAGVPLLAVALAAAGCGSAGQVTPAGPKAPPGPVVARGVAIREPAADPRPYGAADTAFGLDVLGAWCRADPQANLVLSPSSLASGLGMAYLGARGGTARAMASVLHLPVTSGQALEAGLQARSAALRDLDRPGVTVTASDQVWTDPAVRTLPSYLNAAATGYRAGVAQVPLQRSPGRAAQEINQAIAAATRGHIPALLSPLSLQGVRWVLTDALYLNAAWATPFQPSQTSPGPFTTAAGQPVTVPFMHGGQYGTAQTAGWTAVSLPYRGGTLAMIALLPPAGAAGCPVPAAAALTALTTRLAASGTAGPASGLPRSGIALPRVNLSSRTSMKGLLSELGMGVAFGPTADFSGMSPQACCIGLVEHAATLQVGEKGTVASAATAVGMLPTDAQPHPAQIVFDRPYLLMVTDTATGEPLFLARVTNPASH